MAKMTLLEIVQSIMSDMNSDNVNSINSTPESQMVASIVKDTYYELLNDRIWDTTRKLMKLESLTDDTQPVVMKLPERVIELIELRYERAPADSDRIRMELIDYLTPQDFMTKIHSRNSAQDNVEVMYLKIMDDLPILYYNNQPPKYYTSFDDRHLVFDGIDREREQTLTEANSMATLWMEPEWEMVDTFVPDLPAKGFSYLLAEAKSTAYTHVKEAVSEKEEQKSRRQRIWLARNKQRTGGHDVYARINYGRKSI